MTAFQLGCDGGWIWSMFMHGVRNFYTCFFDGSIPHNYYQTLQSDVFLGSEQEYHVKVS